MAARKKTKKPAHSKKPKSSNKPKGRPVGRRVLPNDEAWHELVATAIAKSDPTEQAISVTPRPRSRKAAKKK